MKVAPENSSSSAEPRSLPEGEGSRIDEIVAAHLRILQFSVFHSTREVLSAALDEAERLTGSAIGFLHFLHEDQERIAIGAWSTRTARDFCTAEQPSGHYPLSRAGIWADCIRKRTPIIHNDYPREPGRKGLPEGHATVVRELVVPIFRGESIVGVLGVGNKETPYGAADLEIVDRLAELAWTIVERKVMAERLAESELRYRSLFQDAADHIFLMELDGDRGPVILDVNDAACQGTGYSREELVGRHIVELESPEFHGKLKREVTLGPGEQGVYETEHLRKDGSRFPVEASIRLLPREGAPPLVLSIERDISERKRADEEIRERERKYRQLVEAIPDILYSWSTSRGGISYTENVLATFGQTADYLLAHPHHWSRSIHPDDLGLLMHAIENVFQGEKFDICYRVRHRDGSWRWLRDRAHGIRSGNGETVIDGIATDITEAKVAEQALAISEERFRKVAKSTGEFIWEVDAAGRYTYANSVIEKVLGYRPDEVVGKRYFYDFFPADEREELRTQAFRVFREKGEFHSFRNRCVRRDGEVVELETSGEPVLDPEGNLVGYIGADRDITARLNLEEQLRQSQKMEAIGTLAGGVAHDFNNILQVINTFGFLLQRQLAENSLPTLFADEVVKAGKRAAEVTGALLAFSRKQLMKPKPCDLNEIVRDSAKLLSRIVDENIEFYLDYSPAELNVMADPGQIQQVLLNLVANARDAMPDGGRLIIRTSRETMDSRFVEARGFGALGTYACLTVADSGCGIPAEAIPHIYEPFYTTKGTGKGTGLGLAIVYGIVRQHEGFIDLLSSPDMGTLFEVFVPLQEREGFAVTEEERAVIPCRGDETILLVEDDGAVRTALAMVLQQHGFRVMEADGGHRAVDILLEQGEEIDLAVLDVVMPRMNGREALQELRAIRRDLPVLFVSGYAAEISRSQELLDRHTGLIMKPVQPELFLEKIRLMLDQRPARRA